MNNRISKYSFVLICLLAFAVLAYVFIPGLRDGKTGSSSEGLRNFSVTTFPLNTGWGYRIYQDTAAVIEQQFIPGIAGNRGFKTEEEAVKTGTLVIQKLENGIFPPTVSKNELDSLGIKY